MKKCGGLQTFNCLWPQNVYELNADINPVKSTSKYTTHDLFVPTIESPLPFYQPVVCVFVIQIDTQDKKNMEIWALKIVGGP